MSDRRCVRLWCCGVREERDDTDWLCRPGEPNFEEEILQSSGTSRELMSARLFSVISPAKNGLSCPWSGHSASGSALLCTSRHLSVLLAL